MSRLGGGVRVTQGLGGAIARRLAEAGAAIRFGRSVRGASAASPPLPKAPLRQP